MIRPYLAIIPFLYLATGPLLAESVERAITVSGVGHVLAPPDMARLSVAVAERDAEVQVAQQRAADVTGRVLALLDSLGVDRSQINSTGATVQPEYRWNRDTQEQEFVGYIARRQIEVELRDLELLGSIVEGTVAAGVNQISRPVLDLSTRRDQYRRALAKAAEDARENARVLAESLGARLGPVLQISADGSPTVPIPVMRAQADVMGIAESAPETYNAGDIRLDASISVVFALRTE
jgi:uncharacterized protein YggE